MKRSNRTKQDLATSLKLLMKTSALSDISVQDIVNNSGISRHTFYYHFIDKQDLVQWVFRSEVIEPMEAEDGEYLDRLLSIARGIQKEPAFYAKALDTYGQNSFSEYFFESFLQLTRYCLRDYAEGRGERLPEELEVFVARYATHAIVGIIRDWVKTGMRQEPEELLRPLRGLLRQAAALVVEGDFDEFMGDEED